MSFESKKGVHCSLRVSPAEGSVSGAGIWQMMMYVHDRKTTHMLIQSVFVLSLSYRFQAVFTRSDSGPRVWGARDDVHAHAAKARAAAARVLATLTYMRPAGQAEEGMEHLDVLVCL